MHSKWLREDAATEMEKYHPKYIGFEWLLHKRAFASAESTIIIPLEVVLQRHVFNKHYLGWKYSIARLLYIELKSPDAEHGDKQENDDVELY